MRTQPLCLDKPLTTACLSPEGQQDCLTLVRFIPVTESCLTNEKHLEQFDNVICLHQGADVYAQVVSYVSVATSSGIACKAMPVYSVSGKAY